MFKNKKIIIGLIFIPLFVFFVMINIATVNAMEIDNSDFSDYINCYKNDVYNKDVKISPIYMDDSYNIGIKSFAKYGNEINN